MFFGISENVFADQFLDIQGRLGVDDHVSGFEDSVRTARRQPDVFVADQSGGFDRGDDVIGEHHAFFDFQTDNGHLLLIVKVDIGHLTDFYPRHVHYGAGLQPRNRIEPGIKRVIIVAEPLHFSQLDGQVSHADQIAMKEKLRQRCLLKLDSGCTERFTCDTSSSKLESVSNDQLGCPISKKIGRINGNTTKKMGQLLGIGEG